jgi:hypothetical protein
MNKLAKSNEQTPSQQAQNSSASQDIPCVLQKPDVHNHILNFPPLVPVLSQSNPVHDLPAHFLKIPFYIILLSLCSLPSGLFPSGFHTKTLYTCLISCLCHMSHPSHLP